MIDSASLEPGCPRLVIRLLEQRRLLRGNVGVERCWTFRACLRDPRRAIRQHHSPLSDGCKGLGFAFTKPSIYCIGYGL